MADAAITEASRWRRRSVLQLCDDLGSEDLLAELSHPDCSGVLVVGEPSESVGELVARCPHPLVLMDIDHVGWPTVVTTDNAYGIAQAFDHVYQLGHRRIGFVGRSDDNFAHRERYVALKMKMAEADLPVRSDWVYGGLSHVVHAVEGMRKMLSSPDRPTAVICGNDWLAIGALRAAQSLGLRVPQDLSIVGFDGTDAALLATPALTTVHAPVREIGRQAIRQLMIQILAGVSERSSGVRIRLQPELIVRGSTAPVATANGN
ncbi:MAG TPA: substrate-binding domain-containing protein [Tepidisphaeraceae bacterium]|nr:substrate-binding domain-containing protein [Tepidisphaeraceae bacterium]